jgi:murein DD-endopeptidase MepM/ murein hydrolase activator NlpD
MLRIVRLNERATWCAAGSRGLTLLVVALAAGGCSAGFDRMSLAPMNYNGGPSSTGTAPPIPRESIRGSQAPLAPQGEYRPDYRPEYRPEYRPDVRSDAYRADPRDADRTALPQGGDTTVRMAGLPEPYDRTQPLPRAPHQRTTPAPAPYEAARAPSRPIAAPPQGDTIEVRAGDTLAALAKKHRVSMSELMRANNLKSAHLSIGQQLVLPGDRPRPRRVASLPASPEPASEAAPERGYVPPTPYVPPAAYVPPTPARPTARAPTPEPVLPHHTDAGPIVPPLPETPPPAVAPVASAPAAPTPVASTSQADDSGWTGTYTVQRGDSLYGIARKHGTKPHVLERVNDITNPRKVMPGTVLKVPKPGDTPRVARVTQTPAPTAKAVPPRVAPAAPPPLAASEPTGTPGAPSVTPTIINPRDAGAADERKRVASLGQGSVTDASPPGATQLTPPSAEASPREAAAPESKAATPPGKFRWPARGKIISGFGTKVAGSRSDGINISVPRGTDVHAAESGVVTYAGDDVQGYGNLVLIRHPEGWITAYAHNDALMVKSGETVRRGQIIAKAGATGGVTQPQLHFQVRQGALATPVDPALHLER